MRVAETLRGTSGPQAAQRSACSSTRSRTSAVTAGSRPASQLSRASSRSASSASRSGQAAPAGQDLGAERPFQVLPGAVQQVRGGRGRQAENLAEVHVVAAGEVERLEFVRPPGSSPRSTTSAGHRRQAAGPATRRRRPGAPPGAGGIPRGPASRATGRATPDPRDRPAGRCAPARRVACPAARPAPARGCAACSSSSGRAGRRRRRRVQPARRASSRGERRRVEGRSCPKNRAWKLLSATDSTQRVFKAPLFP